MPVRTSAAAVDDLLVRILRLAERDRSRVDSLLASHSLDVLSRFDATELCDVAGLTRAQGRALSAAFELGRTIERSKRTLRARLDRPSAVARLLAPEVRGLEVETFHVLVLDARHALLAHEIIARGTLDSAPVHPREVFRPALRRGAAAIVVAHNHPSGAAEPSTQDLDVTRRLAAAGRVLGVPVLDHVVLGAGRWTSLRERGALDGVAEP